MSAGALRRRPRGPLGTHHGDGRGAWVASLTLVVAWAVLVPPPCAASASPSAFASTASGAVPATAPAAPAGGTTPTTPPVADARATLVFEADDTLRPAYVEFFLTFRSTITAALDVPMGVYTENFDLARMDRPGYVDELFDWHCRKYRGRRLDVIVPIGGPAYEYALRWRDACAPGTPIVFANVARQELARIGRPPGVTGLTQSGEYGEVVRVAFDLLPETRRVAVVGGPTGTDVYARLFLASARERFAGRAEVLDLTGLPMPTLLERVAALPPGTIVAFTSLLTDGAGRTFVPIDAARLVSRAASVPMFGLTTTQLGHGTVGGRLLSPTLVGREAAALAVRVFRGESPDSIDVREGEIFEYAFDGAQLRRWGIDESALPAGSRVINPRPSLLRDHRATVIVAALAFALQAMLIGVLLRQRRARRRTNLELRRLSGELIVSQENERRRVARELHDDVGQRLALLSIEIDQLRHRSTGSAPDAQIAAVAERANAISVDVHNLARDLHPSRLQTLGLPGALRAYAEEAARRHGVEIAVVLDDWPEALGNEPALVLYRIAQEAVQNAVKHGRAKTITITLAGRPQAVTMAVTDDGAGFAYGKAPPGIGLVGMRERASLAGGSVVVESEPGEGTVVRVVLPRTPPADGDAIAPADSPSAVAARSH